MNLKGAFRTQSLYECMLIVLRLSFCRERERERGRQMTYSRIFVYSLVLSSLVTGCGVSKTVPSVYSNTMQQTLHENPGFTPYVHAVVHYIAPNGHISNFTLDDTYNLNSQNHISFFTFTRNNKHYMGIVLMTKRTKKAQWQVTYGTHAILNDQNVPFSQLEMSGKTHQGLSYFAIGGMANNHQITAIDVYFTHGILAQAPISTTTNSYFYVINHQEGIKTIVGTNREGYTIYQYR